MNLNVSPSKATITTTTSLFGAPPAQTTSLFGAPPSTSLFGAPSAPLPSFTGLAAKAQVFGNADTASIASPIFKSLGFAGGLTPSTQPKPLFGSAAAHATPQSAATDDGGDDGNENQNPEEYEPQVDFKPLVKLEEVEVKTGEEDEDVLFKARCKLYRFSNETKEWKEKGAGEMKVLKHKTNVNVYRILMRRDQIFKLCANHRITADLKLEIVNEKQVRWHAQDYSEQGDGRHELLTAKFRHEDEAKQFKAEVEKAQAILASEPPSTTTPKETTTAKKTETTASNACAGLKPSLSELFNKDKKWTCQGCYVQNNEDLLKCAACQAVRTDGKVPAGIPKSESDTSGILHRDYLVSNAQWSRMTKNDQNLKTTCFCIR